MLFYSQIDPSCGGKFIHVMLITFFPNFYLSLKPEITSPLMEIINSFPILFSKFDLSVLVQTK